MRLLRRVLERKSRPEIFKSRHTIKVCLGFSVPCPLVVCFGRKEHTMYEQSTDRDELRARFTKWMQVLAYRARRKYLAARANRADTISLEDIPEESLGMDDQPIALDAGDGFEFEGETLAKAFACLPEKKRQVLVQLFVMEQNPEETAEQFGCTVQNIYNQRSLALKGLRNILKGEDTFGR